MAKLIRSVLLSCALLSSAQVFATVVDTGSGPDYGGGTTLSAASAQWPFYSSIAGKFTMPGSETIVSVAGWMNWNYPGRLNLSIASDASGIPGSFLYSTTIDVPVTPINHPDWRGADALDWHVAAGNYWLVLSVPTGESAMGSMPQGPVDHPLQAYASDWTASSGFEVIGGAAFGMRITASPVPEPAELSLVAAGLALLAFRFRSNSRQRN